MEEKRERYWNNERMIKQVDDCTDVFEVIHPQCAADFSPLTGVLGHSASSDDDGLILSNLDTPIWEGEEDSRACKIMETTMTTEDYDPGLNAAVWGVPVALP